MKKNKLPIRFILILALIMLSLIFVGALSAFAEESATGAEDGQTEEQEEQNDSLQGNIEDILSKLDTEELQAYLDSLT